MNTKLSLKNRSISLKTVVVTAFLVGLLVFGTTYYVLSPATINVYLDDLPSQATYTIKNDALGDYWAVRYDGYKAVESTNASAIFQYCIDNMPYPWGGPGTGTKSGMIAIRNGYYFLTSTIIINKAQYEDNLYFVGEDRFFTMLEIQSNIDLFYLNGQNGEMVFDNVGFSVKDSVRGSYTHALINASCEWLKVRYCYFGAGGADITGYGIRGTDGTQFEIVYNNFERMKYSIAVNASSSYDCGVAEYSHNKFVAIPSNGVAMAIGGSSVGPRNQEYILIQSNIIQGAYGGSGVEGINLYRVRRSIISENSISVAYKGITETTGCDYNDISINVPYGTSIPITRVGANDKIHANINVTDYP